jgi:hypothetical protein
MRRTKQAVRVEPEEFTARVISFRQSYYISRSDGRGGSLIDDEAILEVEATIDAISERHRKHIGECISISLLNANRYTGERGDVSPFFGSVTFRGTQRSALAYLPAGPFATLPQLIERGADTVQVQFSALRHGWGELLNLWLGTRGDLEAMGTFGAPK